MLLLKRPPAFAAGNMSATKVVTKSTKRSALSSTQRKKGKKAAPCGAVNSLVSWRTWVSESLVAAPGLAVYGLRFFVTFPKPALDEERKGSLVRSATTIRWDGDYGQTRPTFSREFLAIPDRIWPVCIRIAGEPDVLLALI